MTDAVPTIYIVGAGLAGLSAALRLTEAGRNVCMLEAAAHAGGRCRSYYDEVLGCRIDNGNHLLVSGNRSALDYLKLVGAENSLTGPRKAEFPFVDVSTGERWVVSPSSGMLPFWILDPSRRVPGTRLRDYLTGLRLARAKPTDTMHSLLGDRETLYRRFWEPLGVAILNTEGDEAAAGLLWPVLKETFGRGGAYCRPLIVREGLSESFVDPAIDWLKRRGAALRFGTRVRSLSFENERVVGLDFGGETIAVTPRDAIVIATPPGVAAQLVPGLNVPDEHRSIVNAHFLLDEEAPETTITGVLGGAVEWIFRRGKLASTTISAATRYVDEEAETLAPLLWQDVARALGVPRDPMPPYRIVKEKRATFAQTPEQLKRRPPTRTLHNNLVLAGDWTNTGLPATIEGSIRSGEAAALCLLSVTEPLMRPSHAS